MMIEYAAKDKFNMTMAELSEYINSTNGTLTVDGLESWIMQELLVDSSDGNAANETSSGFSLIKQPYARVSTDCWTTSDNINNDAWYDGPYVVCVSRKERHLV